MKKLIQNMLLISGLLILLVFAGCGGDSNSPTNPDPTNVVIVDTNSTNAVPAPCGTVDAVCRTITDGLISAALLQTDMPTVLVKPGTYNTEPAYPIQIQAPVILKAEKEGETIISSTATTLSIISSGVTIEGCHIITNGVGITTTLIIDGGNVTFTNSTINNIGHPADPRGIAVTIRSGGRAIFNQSHIETSGSTSLEIVEGTALIQNSHVYGDVESVIVYPAGSATLNTSVFEGSIFTTEGNLTVNNSETHDISIADGGNATLTRNTIHGWVSLLWKQVYAELTENTIYGRFSLVQASATLEDNTIHGNEYGEGITVFEFADLTLSNNTIFGTQNALYVHPYSTVNLSQNQFDSTTLGIPTIQCEEDVSVMTDGTNTLQKPTLTISCDGLPSTPGSTPF